MRTALVDLDGMIYACAAIAETVYYVVDDGANELRFAYKREANEFCDAMNIPRDAIERRVDAEPVSHAINALKLTVDAAVEATKCDARELYLSPTGKNSFRFDIYPEYKANRDKAVKPVHYKALRNHAVKYMGAIIADNVEADDMLTIRANELGLGNWVMITNDKDLQQSPGDHYNWSKGTTTHVDRLTALRTLYTQVLTGDTIDNIKGCTGIGPDKAEKALRHAESDEEMLEVCKWLFLKSWKFDEEAAMADLKLNIRLVRMLQERPK